MQQLAAACASALKSSHTQSFLVPVAIHTESDCMHASIPPGPPVASPLLLLPPCPDSQHAPRGFTSQHNHRHASTHTPQATPPGVPVLVLRGVPAVPASPT